MSLLDGVKQIFIKSPKTYPSDVNKNYKDRPYKFNIGDKVLVTKPTDFNDIEEFIGIHEIEGTIKNRFEDYLNNHYEVCFNNKKCYEYSEDEKIKIIPVTYQKEKIKPYQLPFTSKTSNIYPINNNDQYKYGGKKKRRKTKKTRKQKRKTKKVHS